MRQAYTDQERARVRELKARGLSGKAIQTRLRIEREENYRAQVQQVNELYKQKLAQGMTPAQAATSQGFSLIPNNRPPSNYTVADGDTVSTIAQQFNMTPQQLLDANPEMTQLRTGMVINTPPLFGPGSERWKRQMSGVPMEIEHSPFDMSSWYMDKEGNFAANSGLPPAPLALTPPVSFLPVPGIPFFAPGPSALWDKNWWRGKYPAMWKRYMDDKYGPGNWTR